MASKLKENVLEDQSKMNNQSTESWSSPAAAKEEEIQTLKCLLQESLRKRYEETLKAPNDVPPKIYVSNRKHLDGQIVHEMRELERLYSEDILRTFTDENVITYDDLLKPHSSTDGHIRSLMIRGISGSGKSTAVNKFVLDWARGRTHQNIDFVFPLHFCELNISHNKKFSLMQLLDLLFPKLLKPEILERSQILFIWDGLGELRFPLNFKNTKSCTDPLTPDSVGCILVNLLQGNLLPSAQILVTSRPKDAGLIPPEHIQKVVELHGFDDLQWEEKIRNEVHDQIIAERVIVHVKSSRALYIMCSLPFFCQMAFTVLEELFSNGCTKDPPITLTEMFTHFLLIQIKRQVKKSTKSCTEEILKLGKLAWHMLEKDTLTFTEKDQRETSTNPLLPVKLSEDWSMFFRKQNLMGLGKMYRFSHPSIQEFLAALYVAVHYEPSKGNVMSFTLAEKAKKLLSLTKAQFDMHRRAVDRALRSKTGQLDMFLLFLLGISAGPSNKLLSCFLQNTSLHVRKEDVVKNILQKVKANPLFEISVNLSRCLEELNVALPVVHNHGRVEFQIDDDVHITPSEWSNIATTLLTSEDSSLTFDVRKYANANEAIMRLLHVIKISRVLRLDEATDLSWALIASTLRSPANRIREIDIEKAALSYINLNLLSFGMRSPNCKVEVLSTPDVGRSADHLLSEILLNPTHLRELKLLKSWYMSDRTVESISQILMDPDCCLQKLTLQGMETIESCKKLAAALCSSSCRLQELDLSRCCQSSQDHALQLLSEAFRHPNFKVTVLRLEFFSINKEVLSALFSAFQENPSHLWELGLSHYSSMDREIQQLFSLLADPRCKLETLKIDCRLQTAPLKNLASALGSCSLKSLDLSMCGLTDSSVEVLSAGLSKPGCKLEILRMTHCSITEAGAACLARALSSNPSQMREIDLSLNPVKGPGFDQLRSVLEDPATRLEKLIVDGLDEHRDIETLLQYACQLTWDQNTASEHLKVSEKDKALVEDREKKEPVPHHPERFEVPCQIMSREGLSSRHFFQVEWFGNWATIGMAYKDISRKGTSAACRIGLNNKSWGIAVGIPSLTCDALHGGEKTKVPKESPWRVGVYLDWAAGNLSFYDTTRDKAELIHTFHAKFTQPLFLLVSIFVGVKILPDVPPPVCVHDHDTWDIFRDYKDCKGCNGKKAY